MNNVNIKILAGIIISLIYVLHARAQDNLHLIAIMTGEQTGDQFSIVAGAGDVNGDGFDDVLVGAPGGNYVKLYFGGAPFDTVADIKFMCGQPEARFGESLDGGSDLNKDGYDDIVIGAPEYIVNGIAQAGMVTIYFGGAQMDSVADIIIPGAGWYYNFGHSVAMAGDVNNDGYSDVIIGAPNDDFDAHGRAYIFFGGADMDSIADVLLEGEEDNDMFGWSVSGAGDINKDNYDDILVGAPQDLKGGSGKAYLIYGCTEIGLNNSFSFFPDSLIKYDSFGRIVCGLGDINSDNFFDFGFLSWSRIEIYYGRNEVNSMADIILQPKENFGFLGSLKDINEDGYADIVTVSDNINIYYGSSAFDTIPDVTLQFWATPIAALGNLYNDSSNAIGFGISGGWDPKGHIDIYGNSIINTINVKLNNLPEKTGLIQNYPNPFNATTVIKYHTQKITNVEFKVFDILGKVVFHTEILNQVPGYHKLVLNASQWASGLYFYQIRTRKSTQTKKMLLVE